jgi:hypothetical protein
MISQLITNAISGASVDVGMIGTGVLLVFTALFAHSVGVRTASARGPRRPSVQYLGFDGKKVSKQEFYRQINAFNRNFDEKGYQQSLKRSGDKRAYWKDPVIWDKASRQYISREEAKQRRNCGERMKKPVKPAGFSRPVRNISARSASVKRFH